MQKKILQSYGLKTTLPRLKVLAIIQDSKTKHLSAEHIHNILYQQDEEINLATVYRILTQFEAAGLLIRHNFTVYDTKAVFELSNNKHHDHLICTQCGKIEEFCNDEIERLQQSVAKAHQFHMLSHALHIYGVCQKCQDSK